jgi:hypothetical protein
MEKGRNPKPSKPAQHPTPRPSSRISPGRSPLSLFPTRPDPGSQHSSAPAQAQRPSPFFPPLARGPHARVTQHTAPARRVDAPSLTPRPHPSAPFFHLPSFFPAPSALCSVQPPLHCGPTPIPAGPLDGPTCISFLLEASPLEPDHAEPLGDPLRLRSHHGRNPRRGVHTGHARPKSPASSLI